MLPSQAMQSMLPMLECCEAKAVQGMLTRPSTEYVASTCQHLIFCQVKAMHSMLQSIPHQQHKHVAKLYTEHVALHSISQNMLPGNTRHVAKLHT